MKFFNTSHSLLSLNPVKKIFTILAFQLVLWQANAQDPQIFGGAPIDIADAPWQISLEIFGNHGCGGTILNAEWVLTAGHCVDVINGVQVNAADLMVHAGATNQTMNNVGQRVDVDQIIIHPAFTNFAAGGVIAQNDLALLHLNPPLCFNGNVQPIAFATPENTMVADIAPGTNAFISGWGDTEAPGQVPSAILIGAVIPIIANNDANILLNAAGNGCPPAGANPNNTMISFSQMGIAAGPGDSGGPAVVFLGNGLPVLRACWGFSFR